MGTQVMATQAARIGKWKGEILAHAIPCEVLQLAASNKAMPKNVSDTVIYRRWVPYGANTTNANIFFGTAGASETEATNRVNTMLTAHLTAEGVTPTPDSMVAQDITVVLKQYSCLYAYTDVVADLYEDDVAAAMKQQVGERMALVREMETYSKLRASTNRFYGGAGTTVATVDGPLTAKLLRKATRSLLANHAKKPTSILAPSPNIGTKPIEASYLVFCHTDLDADLRDTTAFPNYTPVAAYGSRKPIHENEMGSLEQLRFIGSQELVPYQGGGAAVGTTKLLATVGGKIDVYPVLLVSQESYGSVALRGAKSFDISVIPVGNKDSGDPLGQRGYVGAKFYAASAILNQQWFVLLLVGSTDLT